MTGPAQPPRAAARWAFRTTINFRRYGRSTTTTTGHPTGPGGAAKSRRRHRPVDDAGRVSVFLAIALTAVLVIVGLAYDGAGRFRTMQRADNLAAEAARAAGQAIELPQAVRGGAKVIDPEQALVAARAYLAAAGVTGRVEVVEPDRRELRVVVDLGYDTAMLGIIGYRRIAVTGSATAVLVTG